MITILFYASSTSNDSCYGRPCRYYSYSRHAAIQLNPSQQSPFYLVHPKAVIKSEYQPDMYKQMRLILFSIHIIPITRASGKQQIPKKGG